jgi:hypothetical protein
VPQKSGAARRLWRFGRLLHLLTAAYGTGLPSWDVRFHGEYWRVPDADDSRRPRH